MALRFEGIRKGYPRLRRRFGEIAGYIQLLRPFTLIAPFIAGIFGTLAPLKSISTSNIYTAIYVGVTLALAQACGQVINQYVDAELDAEIKPYRPIPSGVVSKEGALGLAWLLSIAAVGRSFTVSIKFGLITLALIFFAVFYSLPPLSPRKIHPILNIAWVSIARGFLPILATFSIFGDVNSALLYSILGFVWLLGFQSTKDIPDVKGDRKYGIKTIPNTYGETGLIVLMLASTIIYTAISILFCKPLMLLNLPLAAASILTFKKQSRITENTYAWACFYIGLGMIYILMFVSER
ncbi:MAG: UbiA family prenyltransferase [Thermoproteota archaeon]